MVQSPPPAAAPSSDLAVATAGRRSRSRRRGPSHQRRSTPAAGRCDGGAGRRGRRCGAGASAPGVTATVVAWRVPPWAGTEGAAATAGGCGGAGGATRLAVRDGSPFPTGNRMALIFLMYPGLDLHLFAPRLALGIPLDLHQVLARRNPVSPKVRAGLTIGAAHGVPVQPHQPARRLAGQLEAGVRRCFQGDGQRGHLSGVHLDALIVTGVPWPYRRDRIRPGGLLQHER